MLGVRTRFVYPRLILEDYNITSLPDKPTQGNIVARYPMYRLDWDKQEEDIRNRFHDHTARRRNPRWDYTPTLPEPYDTIVKAAVFAVNRDFLTEIRQNTQRAWAEFHTHRHLGASNLSELGWGPGIEHIWYAFYLLGDCAYDSETEWFVRGPKKTILQFAMPFKFWGHQTGDGMIWDHAKLDRLRKWNKAWNNSDEEEAEINDFLTAMEDHCQLYLDNRHDEVVGEDFPEKE